jgi:hypothetical protein
LKSERWYVKECEDSYSDIVISMQQVNYQEMFKTHSVWQGGSWREAETGGRWKLQLLLSSALASAQCRQGADTSCSPVGVNNLSVVDGGSLLITGM